MRPFTRTLSLALLLLAPSAPLFAQAAVDPSGHWTGAIHVPAFNGASPREVAIDIDLARNGKGELAGTFAQAAQHIKGLPLSKVSVDGKTVMRYLDLLVDLMLVRRLPPFQANIGKRLVKSPKVFVRDSGIVHALLGISDLESLLGHPVAGASWEGFVIENLVAAAPLSTVALFYRTAAGAEIDLLLEIPGHGLWAIEIKRGLTARPEKGFFIACDDLKPDKRFVVNSGNERYAISEGLEAISLRELAGELAGL
jgi:predicted AAA+ superfamily ATPase